MYNTYIQLLPSSNPFNSSLSTACAHSLLVEDGPKSAIHFIRKFLIELCDNLDNKIIETVNFIVIKIMNFYYRDNSKFLDITVYFTKTNLRNNYKPRHAHTYVFH